MEDFCRTISEFLTQKPNYFSLAPLLQSAILYAGVFCESAKIWHREKNMKNNDGIIL